MSIPVVKGTRTSPGPEPGIIKRENWRGELSNSLSLSPHQDRPAESVLPDHLPPHGANSDPAGGSTRPQGDRALCRERAGRARQVLRHERLRHVLLAVTSHCRRNVLTLMDVTASDAAASGSHTRTHSQTHTHTLTDTHRHTLTLTHLQTHSLTLDQLDDVCQLWFVTWTFSL